MFRELLKAAERAGHKYVSRKPDGHGGFDYTYAPEPGQGSLFGAEPQKADLVKIDPVKVQALLYPQANAMRGVPGYAVSAQGEKTLLVTYHDHGNATTREQVERARVARAAETLKREGYEVIAGHFAADSGSLLIGLRADSPAASKKKAAPAPKQEGFAFSLGGVFDLVKARKGERVAGAKYLRREPDGKGGWRYFYSEASATREAVEGAEISLGDALIKILRVGADGAMDLEIDGKTQTVQPDQWQGMLREHYSDRYYAIVEKRARQWASAVLRHVPRELLSELEGDTVDAQLASLAKRAPEVYARLQRAFHRAGISPTQAMGVISHSLAQSGWSEDARAALIGSTLDSAWALANYRQVARAARRLAEASGERRRPVLGQTVTVDGKTEIVARVSKDGSKVMAGAKWRDADDLASAAIEPSHVAAAIDLRREHGDAEKLLVAAQKQGEQIRKTLRAGQPPQALAQALASQALAQLRLLAQAYPEIGLDDRVTKALQPIAEVIAAAPAPTPKREGADTLFYVAGEGGRPVAMPCVYRLVEAEEAIASHDPARGFKPNPSYPEGLQERPYHRDRTLQQGVLTNAKRIEPGFVVNTNPDATNGPPMLGPDGIVLGGNSRAMSLQATYADKDEAAATKYRQYLEKQAHQFGFRAEDVQALKRPMLVRVVDTTGHDPHLLVRQMNEGFTKGMDPATVQAAMGRRLSQRSLDALTGQIGEDETLAAFLESGRSDELVRSLYKDGIIDARNENRYVMASGPRRGKLNADGRALVEGTMVGKLIEDADLLASTRPSLVSAIARSIPYLTQIAHAGGKRGLGEDLRIAMDAYNYLDTKNVLPSSIQGGEAATERALATAKGYLRELNLGVGDHSKVLEGDRPELLLEILITKPGPVQMANVFKAYAKAVTADEGTVSMFGSRSPEQALRDVLLFNKRKARAESEPDQRQPDMLAASFHGIWQSSLRKGAR